MNRIRKIINQFIFTRWSEKFSATKYMRLVSSTEKSKYRQLYYWHQLIYFRKNHLTFPCTTGFDQRVQKVNMSRCSILTRSELLLLLLVFMEVRIACSSVLPRLFDVHHSSNTCFIQHRKCNIYFHTGSLEPLVQFFSCSPVPLVCCCHYLASIVPLWTS
jgi:hypothetical protein